MNQRQDVRQKFDVIVYLLLLSGCYLQSVWIKIKTLLEAKNICFCCKTVMLFRVCFRFTAEKLQHSQPEINKTIKAMRSQCVVRDEIKLLFELLKVIHFYLCWINDSLNQPSGWPDPSGSYLVQVQHLVPADAPGGLDILHGQGEVDAPGVGQVEVVGVVLVPLLHCCKHLPTVSADNV